LSRSGGKARKSRLRSYSKVELDRISKNLQTEATEYANSLANEIKDKEYPDGVAQLTYGYVPQYRALSAIESLYQDKRLKPEDFHWLYDEFADTVEEIVNKRTGWMIVGDEGDGTVLLAVSPKWAKKNLD
jgi:hypothetical protein